MQIFHTKVMKLLVYLYLILRMWIYLWQIFNQSILPLRHKITQLKNFSCEWHTQLSYFSCFKWVKFSTVHSMIRIESAWLFMKTYQFLYRRSPCSRRNWPQWACLVTHWTWFVDNISEDDDIHLHHISWDSCFDRLIQFIWSIHHRFRIQ